ncbi:LuxR C-terminal-related transcriptional regulator [Candidatus Leptofilum sp.]|uniref:LuxR C-terminal-related transcriptional regulator n=1 Tax=Candidatus Leptofilum sp. TaxID=3241576 RepID=UPI003B5C6294
MVETLLQTKLYLPTTRSDLVPRSNLTAQLEAGLNGRLTLVSAPAGFGKTTLVAHWGRQLEARGEWRLGWYSLDENDNDLVRFLTYFITALQKIDGRLGRALLEQLPSVQTHNIQPLLTELVNDLAQTSPPIILVLDDYHLISSRVIHEGVTFLIEHAPHHFHLLLSSRADPPFSLMRWRVRYQVTEIRQQDLRFSLGEADDFLNDLMALNLPETVVSALETRTEGWVAGLQMAALSLQGQADVDGFIQSFTSSNRFIFDYLAEEVLARRPQGTREFLLKTAVLDRLCAPLCDAVMGHTETADSPSQVILEQLESANLFLIPLDNERRWYRYHHLFADLLQQQSRREQPELANVIHERASRWFEQAGYYEEAVQHGLNAANFERATALLTDYSETWLYRGEISKILLWGKRLPLAWRQKSLKLTLNYAWALLFDGHQNEVEETIAHLPLEIADTAVYLLVLRGTLAAGQGNNVKAIALLEKAEAQLKALEHTSGNVTMRAVTLNSLAYSYHFHNNDAQAQQTYETAIALNRKIGNLLGTMNASRGLGGLFLDQGRLHEAEAICHDGLKVEQQWAIRLGDKNRKLVAAAPIHLLLGRIYYHWNRLDEAETQLVDGDKPVLINNPFDQCLGLLALARLRLAQGQLDAIPPILTQLQGMERAENPPYIRRQLTISLLTIRCALYQQQPTPALQTAIERNLAQLVGGAADPLTHARALVTLDRSPEAVPLLEEVAVQAEADGRFGLWLPTAVLLCHAYHKMGENTAALMWLHRAVETAVSPGYIRLFIDEGEPLRQLLYKLAQEQNAPSYAATLLTHFPAILQPDFPSTNNPLSPREREVLQLIASGLTNQEIALKLTIAPSTAKRHVINIYTKLGINNRAEATARAYELGLVNLE